MGLAFATALSRNQHFKDKKGKKIAIIDPKEPPKLDKFQALSEKDCPEQRTSTLTPSSLRFLTDIGAMEYVNKDRCASYHRIQVWEKDGSSFLAFDHPDNRSMGRTIENSHLVAALYHLLQIEVRKDSKRVESTSFLTMRSTQKKTESLSSSRATRSSTRC